MRIKFRAKWGSPLFSKIMNPKCVLKCYRITSLKVCNALLDYVTFRDSN